MLFQRKTLCYLICLTVIINACGLAIPILRNDDPALYAAIAKHMLISGDWINLISNRQEWLDKPHFPFWLSALSFKIFGINSFAYILPGFSFHLLGAYYSYRLAKQMFNAEVALIATLIYVSSLHLLISAIDVRAEAYLLGEIMPACYYWLIYDRSSKLKPLILASAFTAMAMMTKGIFVVSTIFSGLICSWLYTRQFTRIISRKWLLAYALCLIFILPELICLYLQFDAHPEKMIFGRNQVSGLAWYFWGSQFGRFFNSGPIVHKDGNPFFYLHTFLWAFLPWSLVFIAATYAAIRRFKLQDQFTKAKLIYLLASFWLTFLLFSASKFQLDYYSNILMPFAAILCANYLYNHGHLARLAWLQTSLSYLILLLSCGLSIYLFRWSYFSLSSLIPLTILIYCVLKRPVYSYLEQILIFPSLAICSVFALALLIYGEVYQKYDVGYNLAQIVNSKPLVAVYDLQVNWVPLEFHAQMPYYRIDVPEQLPAAGSYYVVMKKDQWLLNQQFYQPKPGTGHFMAVRSFCGNTIDKVLPYFADSSRLITHLECFMLVEHVAAD